jgi:hypothetical protein
MEHQPAAEKTCFAVSGVIPAQAGIQYSPAFLDSRLRGSDEGIVFFSSLLVVEHLPFVIAH